MGKRKSESFTTDNVNSQSNGELEENTTNFLKSDNSDIMEKNKSLIETLSKYETDIVIQKDNSKIVPKEKIGEIMQRIANFKDIDSGTASIGTAALFRRGAANAGAADTMSIDIKCPIRNNVVEINRYDIVMALNSVVGHKNVRKLAESMAPEMIESNLLLLQKNPLLDLKGDLANRINRKLTLRKEESLTRKEEICCCTYTQWMPNLNELAESTRLRALLEEDLNARRKRQTKKSDNRKAKADKNAKKKDEKK